MNNIQKLIILMSLFNVIGYIISLIGYSDVALLVFIPNIILGIIIIYKLLKELE